MLLNGVVGCLVGFGVAVGGFSVSGWLGVLYQGCCDGNPYCRGKLMYSHILLNEDVLLLEFLFLRSSSLLLFLQIVLLKILRLSSFLRSSSFLDCLHLMGSLHLLCPIHFCPVLTKLALDLHVNFCMYVCVQYFRSFFPRLLIG